MSTLATFRTMVAGTGTGGRLQDAAGRLGIASGGPVDQAIADAVGEYSRVKPLERTALLAGSGDFRFSVSSLTGYVDGLSRVVRVFAPYVSTAGLEQQCPVPRGSWSVERLDTGLYLVLAYTVTSGQQVLVEYLTPHAVDASTSTVYAPDEDAVADLATHYACLTLAGYYAQSTDASIGADVDDRRTKSDLYRSNATRWREAWQRKMGLDESGVPLPSQRPGWAALATA